MSHRRRRTYALSVMVAVVLLLAGCGAGTAADEKAAQAGQDLVRVPADAETITAAMDMVAPGGLVLVSAGTYAESVTIDVEDVTLRGTNRNEVIIDGAGERPFGVVASAAGVRIQNLTVHSALLYGVLVTSMHDASGPVARGASGYESVDPEESPPLQRFEVDHVTAYNNGLYGIYAFNAQHGVITNSYASGAADSGIYVGQCRQCDILVADNVATHNAVGFENANASAPLLVTGNRFSGNRVGMTFISNYREAYSPQQGNVVAGNLISDNAQGQSPAQAQGAFGTGVGISGGQDNTFTANRIEGNPVSGVRFDNTEDLPASGNTLTGNIFSGNGTDVADTSNARAPSSGNCLQGDVSDLTTVPQKLRSASCPQGYQGPGAPEKKLPQVSVPPGVSFLEIDPPGPRPNLPEDESVPDPLPANVQMPDGAEADVPPSDYLLSRKEGR